MTQELSEEQQAAYDAVQTYNSLLDRARQDPEFELAPLAALFATPEAAKGAYSWLHRYRENGIRQVGDNVYHYEEIGSVVEAAGVRSVAIRTCVDTTGSDLVNSAGESILEADRAKYVILDFDVIQSGELWLINGLMVTDGKRC